MARAPRPSLVLLVVLAAALAVGAAASLLVGSDAAQGPATGTAAIIIFPESLVSYVLLGIGLAFVGYLIFLRLTGRTAPVPRRPVVTVLLAVVMAVVFLVISHAIYAGTLPLGAGSGSNSGTNQTTTAPGNGTSGPTIYGIGGTLWSPAVPAWVPFAIVASVLIVLVAIAVPQIRAIVEDRRGRRTLPPPPPDAAEELRKALETADRELGEGLDPRATIRALYASVLEQVTRMVGSVELETPEEIRSHHLVRLGIRPRSAEVLTRLFEEARYSSHPLDAAAVASARTAVRDALSDLARAPAQA